MAKKLSVTSHVSRDFLQNAVYFNTLPKVIWEYVSNSLDNGKDDVPITVAVEIHKERDLLTIADNGMGMSREDMEHFFTMHGENTQRKKGKRVRGRFGTGKSAAFGIAKSLTIDTRKNGKRNFTTGQDENYQGASPKTRLGSAGQNLTDSPRGASQVERDSNHSGQCGG